MALGMLVPILWLAFLVETTAGFGSTILAVTLAAQLYPVVQLLVVILPLNMAVSLFVLSRGWRQVGYRLLLGQILPLMLMGMAVGMGLSRLGNPLELKLAFGLFVLCLASLELWRERHPTTSGPSALSPGVARGWLTGAGLIHGLFATGGPLVVYVLSRIRLEKQAFRATLSLLWLLLNGILLVSYALEHRFTWQTSLDSLRLLPPMLVGMACGEWLHHRLDPRRFRLLVYAVLAVGGLALVGNTTRQLLGESAPHLSRQVTPHHLKAHPPGQA